jgi:hypothetical protein
MLLIIQHALGIAFIGLLVLALFDSVKGTLTILSGLVLLAVGYNLKLFILKRIHPPPRTAQKQAPLSLDRLHDLGFDDLESQIEEVARRRLPDRVLGGILSKGRRDSPECRDHAPTGVPDRKLRFSKSRRKKRPSCRYLPS